MIFQHDLPIQSFQYGFMTSRLQNASITIGDMICKGPRICNKGYFPFPTCEHKVELIGGQNANEGFIEIYKSGFGWGGVCDDYFDMVDAHVICRLAGYPKGASNIYIQSKPFGRGNSRPQITDLKCHGLEKSIFDCISSGWGRANNCGSGEWAGVSCNL